MADPLAEVRIAICEIGRAMWQRSLVAANDGNISVRVGEEIVCTPAGVSKGFMTPESLVVVGRDGRVIAGDRPPSSELKMHLRVYELDEDVTAVVHAHPLYATMMAVQGRPLECKMIAETVATMPRVPVAPYATPSTSEVPDSITPLVRGHNACLLEHHGALTWGPDLMAAYLNMERLEYVAQLTWRLDGVGRDLPDEEILRLRRLVEASPAGTGSTGVSSP